MTAVHRVRIEPLGVVIAVRHGQTLMAAADEAGLSWPTVCGGLGQCAVCRVRIVEGRPARGLTGPERDAVGEGRLPASDGDVRLACQLRPDVDLVVRRSGVRARP